MSDSKSENLFPHFTTLRQKVDGDFWFPVATYADDTLYFRTGPQRMRLVMVDEDKRNIRPESVVVQEIGRAKDRRNIERAAQLRDKARELEQLELQMR